MLLPVLILLFALVAAGVFAYGTEPRWAELGPHGLDLILWTRRLEWPLIATSLLLGVGLVVLVISKKQRIWWLIGLLPILTLFFHRFTAGPAVGFACIQDPVFLSAKEVTASEFADDLIVGIVVDSQAYAFRYASLHRTPVVVTTLRDKRVVLLWSEYANRALAFTAARETRAQDLEIVSMPEDELLVYNNRLGEFINGITGQTSRGATPTGFHDPIQVTKTNWQAWQAAHPDTRLMASGDLPAVTEPEFRALHGGGQLETHHSICMVATTRPIAISTNQITEHPLNLNSGQSSLLVVKVDGQLRAMNRELPGDLVPRFSPVSDPKHKNAAWIDSDTNSEWTANGVMVEGSKDLHGYTLPPILAEDNLDWEIMKYWYPDLHLASDSEIVAAGVVPTLKPQEKPSLRKKKNVTHG